MTKSVANHTYLVYDIVMKILSNFNTNLASELYDKAVDQFGASKVLLIRRDPIYLWFKVIFPSVGWIIGVGILIYLEIYLFENNIITNLMMRLASSIIVVVGLMGIWHVCGKLIDYYMDFTIVTPKHIVSYDQCGIFHRRSISLDLANLRSVNEDKNGIFRSIFNYGTITFFSEGDVGENDIHNGTISLKYINYPRKVREKIIHIIKE